MKKFFFMALLALAVFVPFTVTHAQLGKGLQQLDQVNQGTGLSKADLGTTVGSIIKIVLSLIGTIFLILMIYAGILWMIARGNEEQVATSKNIIRAAIIGLAITLSAYAITYFVGSRLAGSTTSSGGVTSSGPASICTTKTMENDCMDTGGECYWDPSQVCKPTPTN